MVRNIQAIYRAIILTLFVCLLSANLLPTFALADNPSDGPRAIDSTITVKVAKSLYADYGKFSVVVSKNNTANQALVSTTDTTGTASGSYYKYTPKIKMTAYAKDWTVYVKSTSTKDNEGMYVYWSVKLSDVSYNSTVTLSSNGNFSGTAVDTSTQYGPLTTTAPGAGNCSDGVKNGNETGIDEGGRCAVTPPDETPPDENEVTEDKDGPLSVGFNGEGIPTVDIDDTKCTKGSTVYTDGILAGIPCTGAIDTLDEALVLIKNVILMFLLPLVGTIFLIMFIIGGILYITSRGNPQQMEKAKKTLTYAVVGLLVVTLSYTIIMIFANVIGGGFA